MSCRRDVLNLVSTSQAAHAGLLLDSYLRERTKEDRAGLLHEAIEASKRALPLYRLAFERWQLSLSAHRSERFRTKGRVIVGMGDKGVLENGIRLQHSYGIPVIPGSGIKGLCAHYCGEVWGNADPAFLPLGDAYRVMFGHHSESGLLTFEDAWLVPPANHASPLCLDVMTPHFTDYYSSTGSTPPTGQQNPVPIPFLSVEGQFLFAIGCSPSGGRETAWIDLGIRLLAEALIHWGVGSKTRAGYGRMAWVK